MPFVLILSQRDFFFVTTVAIASVTQRDLANDNHMGTRSGEHELGHHIEPLQISAREAIERKGVLLPIARDRLIDLGLGAVVWIRVVLDSDLNAFPTSAPLHLNHERLVIAEVLRRARG